jgi:hypothetical protein
VIRNPTWDAVHRELMNVDRQRLGEPPAVEEMLAYGRGELSPEEESRVRELLVAYPELARAMAAQFPSDDAQPGDDDYLSDEDVAKQWARLPERIRGRSAERVPEGRVLRFWQAFGAIAATLAIVSGALLWRAQSQLAQPRIAWDEQLLEPDGRRGNGDASPILSAEGESVLLVAPLINQPYSADYRVELVDVTQTPRTVWSSSSLRRRANDSFAILVPRSFLTPGKYQVVLYGMDGGKEERMATYTLRVPVR